ncbi:MAG: S41 family peptidase [Clostridia bacterium]|nr:S41 family peptidase [Clostridia bacterium]
MKRLKLSIGAVLILLMFAIFITFQLTFVAVSKQYDKKLDKLNENQGQYEKLESVRSLFEQRYIGKLDNTAASDGTIKGYISGTGDKYATYMSAEEYNEYLKKMNGETVGIGVRVIYDNIAEVMNIYTVYPDSPAEKSGILPGDYIYAVDGNTVSDLGYYGALAAIKGEKGTPVKLTIMRGTSPVQELSLSIIRDTISENTVDHRMYDDETGVIRIVEFTKTTSMGVENAILSLKAQGASKIVFDVRSNLGGDLDGVVKTLDYLLPEGPIVTLLDKDGKETDKFYSDANEVSMPMAVVVNEHTASAAELFAKALSDYQKATVVGVTTYGKGCAQSTLLLPDNSAVNITTHTYLPPYSENYDGIGITPDIITELPESAKTMNIYLIPDAEDTQLSAAVSALHSTLES